MGKDSVWFSGVAVCKRERGSHVYGKDLQWIRLKQGKFRETLPRVWERRTNLPPICTYLGRDTPTYVGKTTNKTLSTPLLQERHSHVCGKDTNETRYFTGFYFLKPVLGSITNCYALI